MGSDEPETMQINTCIKPVSCRTPSAQISSFYESRLESLLEHDVVVPSQFYPGGEDQQFLDQLDFDADAQQTLYEDLLIRKKSIDSMNSIVPRDEDNWNDFNRMNDNNSFIIDNPEEDEPKRDKEILQEFEME